MTYTLVADVGGTGTRLASMHDGHMVSVPINYSNCDFQSFAEILASYLADQIELPRQIALAVAGPVQDQTVTMTNLGWKISALSLAERFGIEHVVVINDFVSIAWATLGLAPPDLFKVGGGAALHGANRGIIGPGTGLGVSGLIATESEWVAVCGEGGHVTMPAINDEESRVITHVADEFGHCSAERLLSGPGLVRIHKLMGGTERSPEQITELAKEGDPAALQTVQMFCAMLGTVAGNLALTLGARGGIYLAGGILPAITGLFSESGFRTRFEAKGRFANYLADVPTYIITRPYPALLGLDIYLRHRQASIAHRLPR